MSALTERLDEWAALAEAATPGPWATTYGAREPSCVWAADDDAEPLAVLGGYVDSGQSEHDAAFIAESRAALPTLVEALRAVLALHRPLDIKVVDDPLCIAEECDHAGGECPTTGTLTICAGCDDLCERADPYYSETNIHVVAWPCPTVDAIAAALGVTP